MTGRRRLGGTVVLGLCSYTHDSAAALIVEGGLVGFAEEERLSGVKHTREYPHKAVAWLLDHAMVAPGDVDTVAYNFDGRRYLAALKQVPVQLRRPATRARALPRAWSFARVYERYRARMRELEGRFPRAAVRPVGHHLAHAAYAFASSGYDAAGVLVVDSLGEVQTTTAGHASRASDGAVAYRGVGAVDDPASLGYAYGAVTEHLGWRRGDEEGTVMALAALGDPCRFRHVFERAITVDADGFGFRLDPSLLPLRVLSTRYERTTPTFAAATCPPRQPDDAVEPVHADLAAALQARTEEVMLELARRARRSTGSGLLCLGGGVAANCVAVGRIVEEGIFDDVHVPSAPGDSGTAIGAALACSETAGWPVRGLAGRCYLGPSYPARCTPGRAGVHARRPSDPVRELATELAEGKIVGLFRGRLEAGPRALGNRSILASPLRPDVVERLNTAVKFREPFRPFAPVVLAEAASKYFTVGREVPFMSVASGVTDLARAQIPSVVHTNGTARVQTVTRDQNAFLADVLAVFASITGVPVLINTSLNVKGKPICGTPEMAVECLVSSGLDALLLEGWWVTR